VIYETKEIKKIPRDLRPREKLLRHGPEHLSDPELLAIILRTGTREADVLSLSKELISVGWKELERMSLRELMEIKGLGLAKASQIKALLELSKRIREPFGGMRINGPAEAYSFLKDKFISSKETLLAVFMDTSNRVIDYEVVAVGSLNRVYVEPRDILRGAVEKSAYGILIAHNHPNGDPKPSEEDITFTRRLDRACEILGIALIDHLIISGGEFTSLRASGIIGA
jgi:DNA repair protein RadC